jgi:hypothetical protein
MNDRRVFSNRTGLALGLALALASGCDANHVLGVADGGAPGPGGPGGSGAAAAGGTKDASGTIVRDDGGVTVKDATPPGPEVGPLGPSQTWTGYVENFMFPSGSDALVLTFAADSQGNAVGTIVLGHGTPPAPATDPNVGYPPGLGMNQFLGVPGPGDFYLEGYSYPFDQGVLTTQRLHFTANLNELWVGWCSLQTDVDGSGSCLPNSGGMAAGNGASCAYGDPNHPGEYIPVDCGKFELCGPLGPCACTPSGCTVSPNETSGEVLSLDIAITGATANGTVDAPFGTRDVQFTKSP